MDTIVELTSGQNPKLKSAIKLKKRRERDLRKEFLIEGYREVFHALDLNRYPIKTLFICPDYFLGENESVLIEKAQELNASCFQLPKHLFDKLSFRDRPDGLVAIAEQKDQTLDDLTKLMSLQEYTPFIVVAESIEKPGNLGTILRSMDAFGAHALIVADACTDIYNPNVVRASVGTLFSCPIFQASSKQTLKWLKEKGIKVVAATPEATLCVYNANFKEAIAIVVGTEQIGLSDLFRSSCDEAVSIPMAGEANSLNVATATTVMLYEVARQRG